MGRQVVSWSEYTEIPIETQSLAHRLEIRNWCKDNIGKSSRSNNLEIENWVERYGAYRGDRIYIFAREEDAVLFALRWS